MDYRLEVVVVPVSDVDRASEFAVPDGNEWVLQAITTRLLGR